MLRPPARSLAPVVPVARARVERDPRRPDPRILARRIAVRRDEGRRRLRRLTIGAGVAAVLVAAALSTRTPLLDVDQVRVDGNERVSLADVVRAAGVAGAARGEPLVDVDEGSVARAVEALPGVAAATVRRGWPGTIVVEVDERAAVAVVPSAGDTAAAVVAADGVVVEVLDEAPPGLPVLEGADGDVELGDVVEADDLLAVAAAVPDALHGRVAAIGPDAAHGGDGVQLRLVEPSVVVRLGGVDDVDAKLAAAITVVGHVDLGCVATIDVRVPTAPALTPAPGCSP